MQSNEQRHLQVQQQHRQVALCAGCSCVVASQQRSTLGDHGRVSPEGLTLGVVDLVDQRGVCCVAAGYSVALVLFFHSRGTATGHPS